MPHKLLTLCGWPVSQTDRRTTPLWTVWTLRSLKHFISAAPSDPCDSRIVPEGKQDQPHQRKPEHQSGRGKCRKHNECDLPPSKSIGPGETHDPECEESTPEAASHAAANCRQHHQQRKRADSDGCYPANHGFRSRLDCGFGRSHATRVYDRCSPRSAAWVTESAAPGPSPFALQVRRHRLLKADTAFGARFQRITEPKPCCSYRLPEKARVTARASGIPSNHRAYTPHQR
jgi:hypothetical protein